MNINILEYIQEVFPDLSKSHKKIATYVLENTEEFAFHTALYISELVGVSESTVFRFAIALGFKGFPEFQKEIIAIVKKNIKVETNVDIKLMTKKPSMIPDYIMKSDIQKIESTMREFDREAFEMAVNMISKAKKIYVVGIRNGAPLACFLSHYLKFFVENVVEITTLNTSEIFEQLLHVGYEDIVIGISFPRYSMRTLKALEFANHRNAKVIAITDSIHSPMNLYSSCNLFAKSNMISIVDSLVAPMALLNALIVSLFLKNPNKVSSNLYMLEHIFEDYQVNVKDEINYFDDKMLNDLKGLV